MGTRRPNRRSSIYLGKDGIWHGWVTVGVKADGSADRRHRKGRDQCLFPLPHHISAASSERHNRRTGTSFDELTRGACRLVDAARLVA